MRESKKEEDAPVLDDDALNDLIARRWLLFFVSFFIQNNLLVHILILQQPMHTWFLNYPDSLVRLLVHCDKSSNSTKITANNLYKIFVLSKYK